MGVTYKAFDTNLRSPAALKVINSAYLQNDSARQRFLREARAAAQLRHPNVATIFHLGHEGVENYFYAMELIEGETFEELIARGGPLPASDALELTLQVTRALIAAHGVGLIHRDIKPSNLMLTRQHGEPLVKVIDFGLAKAIGLESATDSASTGGALTQTSGGFVGTPFFASPEQLENLPLDTRSDIYSLGITLWYLINGSPPFNATSLARVVSEHLSKPPPFERLANQPECVVRLLRRMLEKNVASRPQTPTELRDEIFACLRELPPSKLLDRTNAQAAGGESSPLMTDPGATMPGPAGMPIAATCEIGPLNIGQTLDGRFRLEERTSPTTFRATDLTNGESVALHPLPTVAMPNVTAALAPWRAAAAECPSILRPVGTGITAEGTGYIALEWVVGTATLLDLMRQRGALTLGETLALLEPMATADLEYRKQGLSGAHLEPARILLPPPPQEGTPGFFPRLAPAEIFPETGSRAPRGDETMLLPKSSAVPSLTTGGDPRAFGRLACELLGGPARNWLEPDAARYTPLSSLNEAGNVMLRRCLTSTAAEDGYPNGVEFVAALRRSVEGVVGPGGFPHPVSVSHGSSPQVPGTNFGQRSMSGSTPPPAGGASTASRLSQTNAEPAHHGGGMGGMLALFGLLVVAAAVGIGVWMMRSKPSGTTLTTFRTTPTTETASATPSSKPATGRPVLGNVTPLVIGKAWSNSLGMNFVPVSAEAKAIQAGVWPVRLSDFSAFIDATKYDATGGMYSVGADGKRRQLGRTWKDPGFPQDPNHPVVGINIADAEAFCAWLTKSERDSGLLPAGWRYRLPTDEEWSRLAGLRGEIAALTPEQRGEKSTDLFPWGTNWPPPTRAGNYAGTEAGLPATETIAGYADGFARTSPVGSFPVNAFGLYDVGGNVWQWCSDRFKTDTNWRVVRGGSWLTASRPLLRLGARQGYNPEFRHDDIGFRAVLAPES
jgi:formylglycine-generating enzyme required for sulfatase activity